MPLIPNLTPELKREILRLEGYTPEQGYDVLDTGQIVRTFNPQPTVGNSTADVVTTGNNDVLTPKPPTPSPVESFGRAAAESTLPSLAGLGLSVALPTAAAALAPATGGTSLLALGLLGGLGGAAGASYLQNKYVPEDIKQQLFLRPEDTAVNPGSSFFGGLAPNAIAFNPAKSLMATPQLLKGAGKLPSALRGGRALDEAEKQLLYNAALNTVVAGGQEALEIGRAHV